MTKTFDIIVVGTGSAASVAASRCRSAGWEIAIIDSRPLGGAGVDRFVERISLRITFPSARKFPEEFKGFFSAPAGSAHCSVVFYNPPRYTSSAPPPVCR